MKKKLLRVAASKVGLYPQLRWLSRHTINRQGLLKEKMELLLYSKLIKKGDMVFDVGANVGEKTILFLKLGARVIAFEPQDDCLEILSSRFKNCKNLYTVTHALGASNCKKTFYIRHHRGGSGFIPDWGDDLETTAELNIYTLNEMITMFGKPRYIKIDVEGFELEVLKGLSRPIEYISIEYHFGIAADIAKTIECVNYLSQFGDIRLNLTPISNTRFAYDKWLTKDEFLNVFPNRVAELPGFENYGDLYIHTI